MAARGESSEPARGFSNPAFEHDSCGVAFVATLRGTPGRDIVEAGLMALKNLEHRGAVGAEKETGDGAGILTQIPDAFLRKVVRFELPPVGSYAVGIAFLNPGETEPQVAAVERAAKLEGVEVLAWRDVPVDHDLDRTNVSREHARVSDGLPKR